MILLGGVFALLGYNTLFYGLCLIKGTQGVGYFDLLIPGKYKPPTSVGFATATGKDIAPPTPANTAAQQTASAQAAAATAAAAGAAQN